MSLVDGNQLDEWHSGTINTILYLHYEFQSSFSRCFCDIYKCFYEEKFDTAEYFYKKFFFLLTKIKSSFFERKDDKFRMNILLCH